MARPPVDPRLWRYARSARGHLVLSVVFSVAITVCIVVAALVLGRVLAGVITDPDTRSLAAWRTELVVLGAALGLRALLTWVQTRLAHRAGARVVAELEQKVLAASADLPPRELDARRTGLAVVVTSGLSGLRDYLTGYVPALVLACLVPPIVLIVITVHDPISGAIALVTLPLIPVFMVLIGLLTHGRAEATLTATTRLSDQLLDLFAGMPTLRALGRETADPRSAGEAERTRDTSVADGAPHTMAPRVRALDEAERPCVASVAQDVPRTMAPRVRMLGETLRVRTMGALRIAFLSSMVLELLATLSVALIAVSIGLRLVHGGMELYAGLVALVLAPEVYLPLRTVGERFHAAQDGMAAADKAFAVLEPESDAGEDDRAVGPYGAVPVDLRAPHGDPGRARIIEEVERWESTGSGPAGLVRSESARRELARSGAARIGIERLSVRARDGFAPADLTARALPGEVTVLAGPNGSGKSTALQAILGLVAPAEGRVTVDGVDLGTLDPDAWWARIAWLPQRPVLVPGTLRDNLELFGAGTSTDSARDLEVACAATGFDMVLAGLPRGWETVVGAGGHGLSLGQRQRLALTRVLASGRPILLLDEPTAHLDADAEASVLTALRARAAAGATVVVIGHRATVLAAGDHVIEVRAEVTAEMAAR